MRQAALISFASMTEASGSAVYRLFGSPIVGIAGSLASLIGLGLAVYFYYASVQRPELTYYFHPARTTVVSAGQSRALSFTYNGKQLDKDVTTVHVAIWNAGKTPVRHEDILSPITIQSESKLPILEAKLRKTSRPEILFALDAARADQGIITLDWKALERNDGASIQLIYLGSASEKFTVSGSIIGQHGIAQRTYSESLQTAQEQFEKGAGRHTTAWLALGLALVMSAGIATVLIQQHRRRQPLVWYDVVIICLMILQVGFAVWQIAFRPDDSPPPFGF